MCTQPQHFEGLLESFTKSDCSTREIVHNPQTQVVPMPMVKRAHKLKMLGKVSVALAKHHTLLDVGIDATFSKMSLHNPPSLLNAASAASRVVVDPSSPIAATDI